MPLDTAAIAPTDAVTDRSVALQRRLIADAAARWVIRVGGLATIASILAILFFIGLEVYPLTRPPEATLASTIRLPDAVPLLVPATDEYREILSGVSTEGRVRFLRLVDGSLLHDLPVPTLDTQHVSSAVRAGKDQVVVAADDGRIVGLQISYGARRTREATPLSVPKVEAFGTWALGAAGAPVHLAASHYGDTGIVIVSVAASGPATLLASVETRNLFGAVQRTETRRDLPLPAGASATAVVVTRDGRRAFIGSTTGLVQYWDLTDPGEPRLVDTVETTGARTVAVTALGLLLGDQSVVVGDAVGHVSTWFPVRDAALPGGWRLQRVHVFQPHDASVTAVATSPRDKGFASGDATGTVLLRHATTDRTLLSLPSPGGPVASLLYSPKANGGVTIDGAGVATNWVLRNPHADVSLQSLFGKVWYEGYDAPAYVWQSTGGTDEFEPKFSLIPLIIGTLKGTLYAMLFAIPIAVLGAIYTSQFMHPAIRNIIKPTVEIMAALPSVVLGFLAGLWLAPALEQVLPAVLAMIVVVPTLIFAVGSGWAALPAAMRGRLRPGTELAVLVPLMVAGVLLCLWANGPVEDYFFGGNFRAWLTHTAGFRFDQRNCVVVGFAMGFAVIPIIFTISEDALSNVPRTLTSASLALGATRWQTATRIVFPTASPGIFSATMIGFGRAVGETMIVLMATGNTPVLDFNIFTGMRTLSANIAVEIPEAPHGSSLYRVLFLAALLLFIATFVVNTVAELVRQRLRRRYQQL